MNNPNEIGEVVLSETSLYPCCGLGIHLPDSLDGYYFWERWDRASRPYKRVDDGFAAVLDSLVEDGRLVKMNGRLDMYIDPSAFIDEDNDEFVWEIDYLVPGEANRRELRSLYKKYRLKYSDPEDPGMEWFAQPDVWSDVVEGRVNELILDYRFSNDWDALVVGCDRVMELANAVDQNSHPLIQHGFDHLIAHVQQCTPGRHLASRIRHVESPAPPVPWLAAITVLLVVLVILNLID